MSAETFAILGALALAMALFVLRRAVLNVSDSTVGVVVSTSMAMPFFMLVLVALGQVRSVVSLSWQSYAWLSTAGILHFVIARLLIYRCVQLYGANISQVMFRISPLVTVILGVSLLNEPLTWNLVAGALLIVGGVMVMSLNSQMFRSGQGLLSGVPRKLFLLGISVGLCVGISPILVKMGLSGQTSPLVGVFISYTAAIAILSLSLVNRDRRVAISNMKIGTIGLFILIGLLASTAELMRYTALSMAPASIVSPIFAISPILVLTLSFLFNRKLEVFSAPVIAGTIAVIVGAILIV
ncbi:EamA family transporter [Chloroflexota bacterium]